MARRLEGRVVIATHNSGKLRELRELLAPFGVEAVSAGELGLAEPEEIGTSFAENARIKADAAARATGLPAFADDSGLTVEALGGEPGIHSARLAGPDKDFARAMRTIEQRLAAVGARAAEQRRAAFISALSLVWPDGHEESFLGRVDGTLVWPPRGTSGFGYDPMFLPNGHARTFGEMSADEKHGLPPRGTSGFGYDPMFLPNGHARTFGEMSADEKHGLPPRGSGLSHRARAFMALAEKCLRKN